MGTVKAVAKTRRGPGLELIDRPEPTAGPDDVIVAVTSAAICGTDLHIRSWDTWAEGNVTPVTVLGHEFVGTVAAIGSNVSGLRIGQRVAGEGHITCGRCRRCRAGDPHLCRATVGIGVHRDGAFAEQVALPATNVYPLPEWLDDDIAAILDPLGNAVHTTLAFDLVGEDVLVTGAGPIGQMAAAIARHAGARHVVVTDPVAERRDAALRMGADLAVPPGSASLGEAMGDLGMVEGFDVALEMSGHPGGLDDATSTLVHGGRLALLGVFGEPTPVDLNRLIFKSLTVQGIYGRQIFDTWYKALAMLRSGLDVRPVISGRFPLERFDEAFDELEDGRMQKVLLDVAPAD